MCESRGVSVSGEMFCSGQPTVFFDAAHKRGDKLATRADLLQTIACDDRIAGIIIHIRVRCINPCTPTGAIPAR